MKRLEASWQLYRQRVIPQGAPQVQINETRNGFYAGAASLLGIVMSALEPGTEPTEADLRVMDEIQSELKAFADSKRG